MTSRHFLNKASLNKPNTTLGSPLGSPLGSYRGVAEPWQLYRMFSAVKRIKLTSFPVFLASVFLRVCAVVLTKFSLALKANVFIDSSDPVLSFDKKGEDFRKLRHLKR